jgi:hypothetical protein
LGERLSLFRENEMTSAAKVLSIEDLKSSRSLADRFSTPRPSIADRLVTGKRLRTKVPRASLAEFRLPKARKNPVAILESQAKTRLKELIPVRYARMLMSPFAFLRGAAAIMAQDLRASPVSGLDVQACGDMHVSTQNRTSRTTLNFRKLQGTAHRGRGDRLGGNDGAMP